MVLSDSEILKQMQCGNIIIKPFRNECLGSNSYDVHLGKTLAMYEKAELDAKKENKVMYFEIPEDGFIMQPNKLYLGVTEEYTETHKCFPVLDGKSSTGRLGMSIHITAGAGDVGFKNYWTLEITVEQPLRIYAGMPVGQIIYHEVKGEVQTKYSHKKNAKYNMISDKPQPSKMYKNDF